MLLVLAGIAGTVAVGAWILAIVSALQIVRLAPPGQRLSTWFSLGWWRFDRIRAVAGPAANPLIKRYVWSLATFFAAVLGTIVVSMLVAITGQSAAAIEERTAEPRRINNPRVIAVRTAEDDRPGMISILARRFAPLPAAYSLARRVTAMPNILMPALSPTMEEGKLSKWLVKEGDTVNPGDVLAEIETDKATMEVESVDSGRVEKLLVPEGTEGVKVNTPIALVLGDGEAAPAGEPAPVEQANGVKESEKPGPDSAEPDVSMPAVTETKAPAQPRLEAARDPDLPADVEMVEMTVRQALNEAMAEELRRDKDVLVIGEEVAEYQGAYKITQGLLQEFGPQRIVDTPITEHGFAGLGIGAAFAGLRPIVEFMTFNFAMQAIDQIINSAAKQLYMSGGQVKAPIVFRGPNGAAARVAAQHSQDYSAWYSHIPGLYVIAPFSPADAKGLLKAAIRSDNPVVFLENEILYGSTGLVPKVDDYVLPIGKARIAREGKDVTIASFSMGMRYASQAAEKLVAAGVDVELIDLRTLRPMDSNTVVESVKKTGRLVTVEEGWPQGGIGAELAARVMAEAFDYLDAPVTRVTGKDVPMPYAANLEKLALPSVDEVVAAVNAVTYRS